MECEKNPDSSPRLEWEIMDLYGVNKQTTNVGLLHCNNDMGIISSKTSDESFHCPITDDEHSTVSAFGSSSQSTKKNCDNNNSKQGSSSSKRSRASYQNMQNPFCQVEGCNLDFKMAKDYHRRHRICEGHSKSPKVVVGGLVRRFCQQCSSFHDLSEFDDNKRSCRKRLSDHNARRRRLPPDPLHHHLSSSSSSMSSALYDHSILLMNGLKSISERQQQQQQQNPFTVQMASSCLVGPSNVGSSSFLSDVEIPRNTIATHQTLSTSSVRSLLSSSYSWYEDVHQAVMNGGEGGNSSISAAAHHMQEQQHGGCFLFHPKGFL